MTSVIGWNRSGGSTGQAAGSVAPPRPNIRRDEGLRASCRRLVARSARKRCSRPGGKWRLHNRGSVRTWAVGWMGGSTPGRARYMCVVYAKPHGPPSTGARYWSPRWVARPAAMIATSASINARSTSTPPTRPSSTTTRWAEPVRNVRPGSEAATPHIARSNVDRRHSSASTCQSLVMNRQAPAATAASRRFYRRTLRRAHRKCQHRQPSPSSPGPSAHEGCTPITRVRAALHKGRGGTARGVRETFPQLTSTQLTSRSTRCKSVTCARSSHRRSLPKTWAECRATRGGLSKPVHGPPARKERLSKVRRPQCRISGASLQRHLVTL
jgi:hypothetical protein